MLEPVGGNGQNVVLSPRARPLLPILWLGLGAMLLAALGGADYVTQVVLFERMAPLRVDASIAGSSQPLRPETPLRVTLGGQGVEPRGVGLYRRDAAQPDAAESAVTVRLAQVEGTAGEWQVVDGEGASPLRTDGDYRLVVRAAAPTAAFPLPREEIVERQYRFSTVASPRLAIPTETVQPAWGDPVPLQWTMPMESVSARTQPPVPVNTWVDKADPTRTWLQVGDQATRSSGTTTYDVVITRAQARDGLELQTPALMQVSVAGQPRVLDPPRAPVTIRHGDVLTLALSEPLAEATVTSDGALKPVVNPDGRQLQLSFPEYVQGESATIRLAAGVSPRGGPLAEPVEFQVTTPPALALPVVTPADGARLVLPSTRLVVAFDVPVADRAAAEQTISIDPPVSGQWRWTGGQSVELTPDKPLSYLTDYTVSVKGGPGGPRAAAGGYLDQDVTSTFRTIDFKRIEVDLTRQRLYMLEAGQVTRTIVVGTGVRGAETPVGQYEVLYKMTKTRMRGVNPNGVAYDIPDVPWVLPFLGDYALHGNYWRSTFGSVGSNGCIGMSVGEAKILYDWADVGTPIVIYG